MRLERRIPLQSPLLALLLLPACDKPTSPADSIADPNQQTASVVENSAAGAPFDQAQVFFEFNTTDHDMGFQVFLDAEGWRRVSLTGPQGRLFGIQADGRLSEIGITELRFESAEPSPAEVRSRFPAGRYTFRGETVEGGSLVSHVTLSQRLLAAPSFSPRNGQVVDPRNTVVRWNAPGAERVELIIENDELGHVLDVTVSGSTDRMTIPRQFLRPGMEYKIEILAIAENGNRTIAESTFKTGS